MKRTKAKKLKMKEEKKEVEGRKGGRSNSNGIVRKKEKRKNESRY